MNRLRKLARRPFVIFVECKVVKLKNGLLKHDILYYPRAFIDEKFFFIFKKKKLNQFLKTNRCDFPYFLCLNTTHFFFLIKIILL